MQQISLVLRQNSDLQQTEERGLAIDQKPPSPTCGLWRWVRIGGVALSSVA